MPGSNYSCRGRNLGPNLEKLSLADCVAELGRQFLKGVLACVCWSSRRGENVIMTKHGFDPLGASLILPDVSPDAQLAQLTSARSCVARNPKIAVTRCWYSRTVEK